MKFEEAEKYILGKQGGTYFKRALERSQVFRQDYKKLKSVIKANEMEWELSPHGILKHMVNEEMGTKEPCLEVYMQLIPPGSRSGKHRHLAEELFYVVEGRGYDLHWDVKFDCEDEYSWDWEGEPQKFEWKEGDFVYVPPYTMHQHFNADPGKQCRLISATNGIVRKLALDWIEQVEEAPEYQEK